ncbi:hypothetical protein [Bradyrhizobium sp. Tv2a-2]|uniref:hypothetical protein n=1 Tax=Bradyrhizobium sp. Tv2a-2 TaxID=113395 RepID=UPI0003F9AA48|nr:hypothetical protein [Bradyrhizobium sp. Tv2a-2]
MPCDSKPFRPQQTLAERKEEVRRTVEKFARGLADGTVKAVVGPQGAIAFTGVPNSERNGVTDSCVYRRLLATGSAMARQQIARAEQLAGRRVDQKVVAGGTHGHFDSNGNVSWHKGH